MRLTALALSFCWILAGAEIAPLERHFSALLGAQGAVASYEEPQQIAIIGAGAAGASAAYHLTQFAAEANVGINITIFEKTNRVGGRTLTVNAYDDPKYPVELGASIFIELNHIVYGAASRFNMSLVTPGPEEDEHLVIWDGTRFRHESKDSQWDWWKLAKLFWKYGQAPYRAQKLMKATVAQFLKLYEAPHFPFRSLTTTAYELGLTKITGLTGEQFLEENNIGSAFSQDIIQAATRVNYASNLGAIHGLDTMVSISPEGASQVTGGNWQIFDSMVRATNASLTLNTSVASIMLEKDNDNRSVSGYIVETNTNNQGTAATTLHRFDNVIIATPYQFSDIHVGGDVLQQPIDEIPYVKLHVTLFASRHRISPGFFNMSAEAEAPTTVLTTLGEGEGASSGAGKAGFYSISNLRTVTNPATGQREYLYKIFSPEKVTTEFMSSLLGVQVPEQVTAQTPDEDLISKGAGPVTWYYPHMFYSYPQALPRVTFQDPILGPGLYYTSGMESFISTMETSALMGKNVARLIMDAVLVQRTDKTAQSGEDKAGVDIGEL